MLEFKPDDEMSVTKMKIGHIPTLIVRSKVTPQIPVAILWLHGGGYMTGMKEMIYTSRAIDLMKRYGVTLVSPGYRLSWWRPYPAAVDDCYEVLQYIDEHREELHIDRIMVGGESAGGGLCAAVCMMARDRGIPVAYQMPLYPMLDNYDTDSSRDNHGRVWDTRKNHLGWRLYLRGDAKRDVSPYASPSRQTDYAGLPPCYTFVGDGEPFYDETLKYIADLQAAGVEASVDVYHTDMHSFDLFETDSEMTQEARWKFIEHFEYALAHYGLDL